MYKPIENTSMSGNKTSKVLLIKSSLESTAEEPGYWTKSAGKDADDQTMPHKGGAVARVEVW